MPGRPVAPVVDGIVRESQGFRYRLLQEGIMGAAQYNRIDLSRVLPDHVRHEGIRLGPVQAAAFRIFHQARTAQGDDLTACRKTLKKGVELFFLDGQRGGQDQDVLPACIGRRFQRRLNADNRPARIKAPHDPDRRSRRGIAGDDKGFGMVALLRIRHRRQGQFPHLFCRLRPVRGVGTVSEENELLVRHQPGRLFQDGNTANAGIHGPDGGFFPI